MDERRVRMVCETCGSEEVTHDAWASWDTHAQEWTLGATFDYAYCHSCDGDTHITEVPF